MAVIDGLEKRFGKFALVVAVATRAKELKEGFVASREVSGGTAIGWAITEIARGDVRIRAGKPGDAIENVTSPLRHWGEEEGLGVARLSDSARGRGVEGRGKGASRW